MRDFMQFVLFLIISLAVACGGLIGVVFYLLGLIKHLYNTSTNGRTSTSDRTDNEYK